MTNPDYAEAEDKALHLLSSFVVTNREKQQIERATVGQAKNALWYETALTKTRYNLKQYKTSYLQLTVLTLPSFTLHIKMKTYSEYVEANLPASRLGLPSLLLQ